MGSEVKCRVRVGGRASNGTALLETDELVFRGDFRLRIALKTTKRVEADGDVLVIETADGTVARFDVGRLAAKWAEKIRSPPSRLDKLGVTGESKVALIGAFDDDFTKELAARAACVGARAASLVLFAASSAKDLARVAALRKKLPDDGALWIVYPKGRKEIREADVLESGRATGMKDVKVARFSDTHTALKFVVPLDLRKKTKR
jgi:hypothetical protein